MTVWQERSPAQAAMLNPALLAVVAAAAAVQYERTASTAMVWPTTYLIAPLVLHRATRQALPRTTATHLAHWIHEHPVLHAGFSARAASLAEPVREGLRFGLAHGALRVDDQGRLSGTLATSPRSRARQTPTGPAASSAAGGARGRDEEVEQIVAKAGLVGRWLAKLEQPATAFVMLVVAP